ncbi:MAG: hypothetical protein KGL35_26350 [Bradyrhizobium sp.]|nr:hypothetical protein [Bradyrhizobium sp.]
MNIVSTPMDCLLIDHLTKSGPRCSVKLHQGIRLDENVHGRTRRKYRLPMASRCSLTRADKMSAVDVAMSDALVAATDRLAREKVCER